MRKYFLFSVGGEVFGVSVEQVVEVFGVRGVIAVPDIPDYFPGVTKLRNEVIPLMDMRKRFSVEPSQGKTRSLMVRTRGEKVGLLVDQTGGLADFDNKEISPPPAVFRGLKSKYLQGLGKKEDHVVMLLDIDTLITSDELIVLREARESVGGESA